MRIIKPKTDYMLRSSPLIDSLCSEIKRIGITFFSHTRIFNDGSRIDLNNHPEMIAEFYYGRDEMYKVYTPEVNPQTLNTNILFLDSFHDNKSVQFLRDGYNIDHMVVEIDKHKDYCDIWNFGTSPSNQGFYANFCSNREIINLFKEYYLSKASKLIEKSSQDRIIIIDDKQEDVKKYNSFDNKDWFAVRQILITELKKLDKDIHKHLTATEMQYCGLLAKGLSRTEIAKHLFKSPRTVDAHIQNIKQKLNCRRVSEMRVILRAMGFHEF